MSWPRFPKALTIAVERTIWPLSIVYRAYRILTRPGLRQVRRYTVYPDPELARAQCRAAS